MKTFIFYKDNKLEQKFTLTREELIDQFRDWMKTKDQDWLEYYHTALHFHFVGDKEGLGSVTDHPSDYEEICGVLRDVKWEYLNSIGIK